MPIVKNFLDFYGIGKAGVLEIKKAVEALAEARTEDNEIRLLHAAFALAGAGEEALPAVAELAASANGNKRWAAGIAIGDMNKHAAKQLDYLASLDLNNNFFRKELAADIARMREYERTIERTIELCLALLKDPYKPIRENAAGTLANTPEKSFRRILRAISVGEISQTDAEQAIKKIRAELARRECRTGVMREPIKRNSDLGRTHTNDRSRRFAAA